MIDLHRNPRDQFEGQLTNINLYTPSEENSIEILSKSPCNNSGDIISGKDLTFELYNNSNLVNTSLKEVCSVDNIQISLVALPVTNMGFYTANDACRRLVKGNITEFETQEDLQTTIKSFKIHKKCLYFWTPYSGAEFEAFPSLLTFKLRFEE